MSSAQQVRTFLRRYSSSRTRDRVRRSKIARRKVPGPPPGADPEVLADVTQRLLGVPARFYYHASVSGYKEATAFIVWLESAQGESTRLFFKDVNLGPDHYPAIVGFPGRPGLPEAALYANPTDAMARFLPKVYAHVELAPQVHYQYFLEDLNATHRWGFDHGDVLWAVDRLFEVSSCLADWIASTPDVPTIRYDGEFPTKFIVYARGALERYAERTGEDHANNLIDRWDAITKVYLDETPAEADDAVHGDYRRDNMFHDRKNPEKLTVLDWEYAGTGWIHFDLVSLLKKAEPRTVDAALARVSLARPQRTLEEHWRLYQRCRLERGLLDAALVANQRLARSDTPKLSSVHFERIFDAYDVLSGDAAEPIGDQQHGQ